jgi:hypothetical protein
MNHKMREYKCTELRENKAVRMMVYPAAAAE